MAKPDSLWKGRGDDYCSGSDGHVSLWGGRGSGDCSGGGGGGGGGDDPGPGPDPEHKFETKEFQLVAGTYVYGGSYRWTGFDSAESLGDNFGSLLPNQIMDLVTITTLTWQGSTSLMVQGVDTSSSYLRIELEFPDLGLKLRSTSTSRSYWGSWTTLEGDRGDLPWYPEPEPLRVIITVRDENPW